MMKIIFRLYLWFLKSLQNQLQQGDNSQDLKIILGAELTRKIDALHVLIEDGTLL